MDIRKAIVQDRDWVEGQPDCMRLWLGDDGQQCWTQHGMLAVGSRAEITELDEYLYRASGHASWPISGAKSNRTMSCRLLMSDDLYPTHLYPGLEHSSCWLLLLLSFSLILLYLRGCGRGGKQFFNNSSPMQSKLVQPLSCFICTEAGMGVGRGEFPQWCSIWWAWKLLSTCWGE